MMKLNKNKRIGKVLFIVEGEKTEIFILKKIFNEVFGYNYASINRRGKTIEKFNSINDVFSMVFVINSEKTNISSIEDGYDMQGMLLLSYPAIESFTLENFYKNIEHMRFELGNELKNSEKKHMILSLLAIS